MSAELRVKTGGARRLASGDYSDFPDEALVGLAAHEVEGAVAEL